MKQHRVHGADIEDMVTIRDPRTSSTPAGLAGGWEIFREGPDLGDVVAGRTRLQRGDSGESVRALQRLLNALGAEPPLATDGRFGPLTEAAVRDAQVRLGTVVSGQVGSDLWAGLEVERALRGLGDRTAARPRSVAPRFGAKAPSGGLQAGQLAREAEARRNLERARTPSTAGAPSATSVGSTEATPSTTGDPRAPSATRTVEGVQPATGQTRADAELEALQRSTVTSAERELAAGVRADQGPNRGARVDQYARDAGMPPGGAWCGYFTGFNYDQAAREAGGRFPENVRFHSFQKARSYFEYRNFTNASPAENQRLDRLRDQQVAEGSARRFMVLSGSGGEQHARTNARPAEVYEPSTLPLRPGDTALFSRGHLGVVESYDAGTGRLVTIEGNSQGGRVNRNTYDLNNPQDRARFEGFGRPARGDFALPTGPGATSPATPAATLATPATAASTTAPTTAPAGPSTALALPPRPEGAMTGSQFLEATKNLSRADREQAILRELERGNVPDFLRQLKEVQVESTDRDGQHHTGTVRVLPAYLAIGSNDDFVQIPMDARTAQRIADATGTSLPTRRIVDEVYRQADVKLTPQPLPAGPQMMSNDYYRRHNQLVADQRRARGVELGQLTAGDQKDLVISNMLTQHPGRVAIYGWHQPNGHAIQPLSTVHEATYADYSHGVRLVGGTMMVDGQERPIADVLADPRLAGLVSDEGVIRSPRVPGV